MPLNAGQQRKKTTCETLQLDVRHLQSERALSADCARRITWSGRGKTTESVRVQCHESQYLRLYQSEASNGASRVVDQKIHLAWTSCHYGKQRPWFCCPTSTCDKRAAILYLETESGLFLCRGCCNLVYETQRESKQDRLYRKRTQYARKLGRPRTSPHLPHPKPRYMHQRTWDRLTYLLNAYQLKALCVGLPEGWLAEL
jgi:hypothetical protein